MENKAWYEWDICICQGEHSLESKQTLGEVHSSFHFRNLPALGTLCNKMYVNPHFWQSKGSSILTLAGEWAGRRPFLQEVIVVVSDN